MTNPFKLSSLPKGFFAITLAVCLLSMSVAQPIFFLPEAVAAASFTTAGGLVFTGASGATLATVPTGALLLGAAAKKIALLKLLAEANQ